MSGPEVCIELDAESVCVGGQVTGRLRVSPGAAGPGEALVVLRWRTQGQCTEEVKEVVSRSVPPIDGTQFALPVPSAGPMSYEGTLFSIQWEAVPRIDGEPGGACPLKVTASTPPTHFGSDVSVP